MKISNEYFMRFNGLVYCSHCFFLTINKKCEKTIIGGNWEKPIYGNCEEINRNNNCKDFYEAM